MIRGLRFTIKGGPGSGHSGHGGGYGGPDNPGGSTPSSSLSMAGIESSVNPGGKALAEGRTSVDKMTKKEFASLYHLGGARAPADAFNLGIKHGWESGVVERARAINDRAKVFAHEANERHRKTLRKEYPEISELLISSAMITSLTAEAAWDLMTGNLSE